jgi:hypothetical protein
MKEESVQRCSQVFPEEDKPLADSEKDIPQRDK